MKILFYLFLTFFSFYHTLSFSQDAKKTDYSILEEIDKNIQESKVLASSDPAKATKNLLSLKLKSENIKYNNGIVRSSLGLMLLYYNGGEYKKTIKESLTVEKYAKELQYFEYISDTYRIRSNVYGEMGLLNQSLKELEKAIPYADKIEQPYIRFYKKALIYESYAGIYDKKGDANKTLYYRQESIKETKKMTEPVPVVINAKYQNLAYQYASMGLIYSNLKINDSADYYFEKALGITENKQYEIYTNAYATLLSDMAKFYNMNGRHQKAISFAKRAEKLEKQAPMPYIRRDIYHSLFNSYVETAKKDSSKYYLNLYNSLNDSLLKTEKENILAPVKQIISDKETENKNTIRNILITSAGIFILMFLIIWKYLKRKNRIIHKKYEELIAKITILKEQKSTITQSRQNIENNESQSSVNITDETVNTLLYKLEKFETSEKYLRKGISLTWLANNLNTNTKYLSEIIKIHRNKNFNNYINGLRINYITHKLIEDPLYREYKIGYLADECGYASQQVFVISFKKETGFTPSYFIENLKKDNIA